jgi:hypothetical protein
VGSSIIALILYFRSLPWLKVETLDPVSLRMAMGIALRATCRFSRIVIALAGLPWLAVAEEAWPSLGSAAAAAAVAAAVLPTPGESAWLEIPWETDLWEARRRAAAEGKPVFLWEMDGHPLGCT